MNDYQSFCNFLTAAQRGRSNTTPKTTPPRAKAKPTRPANVSSDAVLKQEIINLFNGR